jgi:flagellar hook-basal body complex protein FliE
VSDPLRLIGPGNGTDAASAVGRGARPSGPRALEPGAPSFKDVLMANIKEVNKLQQDTTRAVEDLHSGRRTDVEGVAIAMQKADTAFKMLQAVRNKVVAAYEEIQQMRV